MDSLGVYVLLPASVAVAFEILQCLLRDKLQLKLLDRLGDVFSWIVVPWLAYSVLGPMRFWGLVALLGYGVVRFLEKRRLLTQAEAVQDVTHVAAGTSLTLLMLAVVTRYG